MKQRINRAALSETGMGPLLACLALAAAACMAPAQAQAAAPIPPGAVLAVMQNVEVPDQQDEVQLEDGVTATFWYGRELDFQGKHYYSAFVWHTRDAAARQGEDFAAPEVQVRLAEATFERTHPGQTQAYTLRNIEHRIGFFGGREKPEEVDLQRPPLEHTTADGRLLLAVPTATFDSGVTTRGYTLFLFNPNKQPEDDGWVWSFVGQLRTGEENSAACDGGAVMTCADSDGVLHFSPGQGAMPQVTVQVSGTVVQAPGKVRPLVTADNYSYVYDQAKGQYINRAE
ncbi:hypothetical protein J4P02_11200 [Pseudomonas sp. NFXW11]|uniref:hypothetical protein n=1 Tax=Pseudomonas sp. NFXW11 TaxID=2819531 RepID=UPI003CF539AB